MGVKPPILTPVHAAQRVIDQLTSPTIQDIEALEYYDKPVPYSMASVEDATNNAIEVAAAFHKMARAFAQQGQLKPAQEEKLKERRKWDLERFRAKLRLFRRWR